MSNAHLTELHGKINFDYPSRETGQLKNKTVFVIGIFFGREGDYIGTQYLLRGLCSECNEIRTFGLNKMVNIKQLYTSIIGDIYNEMSKR